MSKRKKKGQNNKSNEITKGIFTVLEKEPGKSFNYKQIAAKIGLTDTKDRNDLIKKLVSLKEKKRIVLIKFTNGVPSFSGNPISSLCLFLIVFNPVDNLLIR